MNKILFTFLLLFSLISKAQLNDLIITEFVDWSSGSGFAVKLYNPTSAPLNLSNYYFHYFTNGNSTFAASEQLYGTLASNQTVTISNNPSDFTMPCSFNIVLTNLTAGTNDNDGIAITRGPAATVQSNSQFVDMINLFGTDVAPKIDGSSRGLFKNKISRASSNCTRYTSLDGFSANSWPSTSSVNVQGWTVSSVSCLGNGNAFNPFSVQQTVNVSFCDGDSALINGRYVKQSGVYRDTLPAFSKCDSIVQYTVTVNPLEQKSAVVSICQGDSVFLQGSFQSTAGTYVDRIPSSTGGCDTLLTTTVSLNGAKSTTQTVSLCQGEVFNFNGQQISASGTYADTTQLSGGCDSIHTVIVTVTNPVLISETYTICDGETVMVNGLSISNPTTIRYIKPNPTGCDTTVDATVNVITINADFTFNINPLNTLSYSFFAAGSPTAQYLWDFGDGGSSTLLNPQHEFEPGVYRVVLKVIGENGCEATTEKQITVLDDGGELFIPNVFTPNGDGTNDVFKLTFAAPFELRIAIFNRWGELLFESGDCYFEWDGTYKGDDAQDGTYVYLISGKYNRKGTITLLR